MTGSEGAGAPPPAEPRLPSHPRRRVVVERVPSLSKVAVPGVPAPRRSSASEPVRCPVVRRAEATRLLHHLGPPRPRRLGRLGGFADHDGHESAAPQPAVRPRPAGAGPRRGAVHDRDRPSSTTRGSASSTWTGAGAHPRDQRPRPQRPAARRRVDGPGRDAGRPRAGRPRSDSSNWWAARCWPPPRPLVSGRATPRRFQELRRRDPCTSARSP